MPSARRKKATPPGILAGNSRSILARPDSGTSIRQAVYFRRPRSSVTRRFARAFSTQLTSPTAQIYRSPSRGMTDIGLLMGFPELRPVTVSTSIGPTGRPLLLRNITTGLTHLSQLGRLGFAIARIVHGELYGTAYASSFSSAPPWRHACVFSRKSGAPIGPGHPRAAERRGSVGRRSGMPGPRQGAAPPLQLPDRRRLAKEAHGISLLPRPPGRAWNQAEAKAEGRETRN
jgi:hypothetical protein